MKVLIVCVGSVGDVYPLVAVGVALHQRGHRVSLLANPYYRTLAEENDLGFHAVGTLEDQQKMLSHPDAWHPRRGWKAWGRFGARASMRDVYETIEREYEPGRTVAVTSWGGLGARLAQEKLGVPMASLYMEPDKLRSVYDPPPFDRPIVTWGWLPRWFIRWEYRLIDMTIVDPVILPKLNMYRKRLGLRKVCQPAAEWLHSPQRIVGLFPQWFGAPQADWPPQAVQTGFPLWDRSETVSLPDRLQRFLDQGDPPILFTPGAINLQARRFFVAAVHACRLLKRRGILLTQHPELLPDGLPEGVCHFKYVPFGPILPRVAAVVHHAGIGTTAQCLAAGAAQVVMPQMHFHRDTAKRLRRLGVGLDIRPRRFTGPAVARAVRTLLDDPQVDENCRQVAARFNGTEPIERTCDYVEQLVGTERRPASGAGAAG